MTSIKDALLGAVLDVESLYDQAKLRLRERLGLGSIIIMAYLGHGTREKFYLKGRVLRDKHITSAMDDDSVWLNLLNMYKRYQSDEIPGARVQARLGDVVAETMTDEEGYFYFELSPHTLPQVDDIWYDVELELLDYPGKDTNPAEPLDIKATGKVIVPPPEAQFGVISDIDDTVMRTDVLDLLAMARNTFLMNSRTRLPFEGVAAFYQALRKGNGKVYNPIYYVSSSSWNLYDMIVDFFTIRGIPAGPLFLVDLGIDATKIITPGHHTHKIKSIETLLHTHPELKFILIGDSGQKDAEIYLEIIERNPGRILAAYIRDVTNAARDVQVQTITEHAAALGVELLAVKDTVAAAVHASTKGFINPEALPDITEDTIEDKQAPTPIEQAIKGEAATPETPREAPPTSVTKEAIELDEPPNTTPA